MGEMAELHDCDDLDFGEPKCLSYITLEIIEAGFWRDNGGLLHKIERMETSHLSNLVKLLERQDYDVPPQLLLELEYRQQHSSRDSE